MPISDNIKKLRTSHKLSQIDFGKIAGVTDKAVSSWENGEKTPRMGAIQKLADYFGISKSEIIEDPKPTNTNNDNKKQKSEVSAQEFKLLNKYRILDDHGKRMVDFVLDEEYSRCIAVPDEEEQPQPTISIRCSTYKVSAGRGFELGNSDDWEEIEIPDSPEAQKADFAIEIKGDSMEPVYFDGDIILVKEQGDIDEGQIGVFILNGDGYIKKRGKRCLISLNDNYDDIEICEYDDFRCAGKVIGRV